MSLTAFSHCRNFLFLLYDLLTRSRITLALEGVIVPTLRSVSANEMPQDQLRHVVAEYLELEQAQVFRRLLVARCGRMAAVALVIAISTHALSTSAWIVTIGLILSAPLGAWIFELQCRWRLARHLDTTCRCTSRPSSITEKVVKSS